MDELIRKQTVLNMIDDVQFGRKYNVPVYKILNK